MGGAPLAAATRSTSSSRRARAARAALHRARRARARAALRRAPARRGRACSRADELDEARRAVGGPAARWRELRELARDGAGARAGDARRAGALARACWSSSAASGPTPGPSRCSTRSALRARRVRALFLCGLQEGVFPAPARPQPLLGEEERRSLAEARGPAPGRARGRRARRASATCSTRPSRARRSCSCSAGTRPTTTASPPARSLFVDDVCDLFDADARASERRAARARRGRGGERRPSRAGAAAARAAGACADERLLRDERVLAALRERPWSASSLERWIGCPVRWFVERLLRPSDLEPEPEPLARGGLAHAALKDTLEGLRAQTGSARVDAGRPASSRASCCARALERARARASRCRSPPSAGPGVAPAPARRPRALPGARRAQRRRARSSRAPPRARLRARRRGRQERESALPALDLGDGLRAARAHRPRRRRREAGEAVVYDYKGSDVAPAGASGSPRASCRSRCTCAPSRACSACAWSGGFYQPLTGGDLRARGVLDADSGVELDCVRGDRREHARGARAARARRSRRRARPRRGGRRRARPRAARSRRLQSPTMLPRGERLLRYPTICRCEPLTRTRSPTSRSRRSRAGASRCCWRRAPAAARPRCSSSASSGRCCEDGVAPAQDPRDHVHRARRRRAARAGARAAAARSASARPRATPRRRSSAPSTRFCARLLRAHPLAAGLTRSSRSSTRASPARLRERAFGRRCASFLRGRARAARSTCSRPTAPTRAAR